MTILQSVPMTPPVYEQYANLATKLDYPRPWPSADGYITICAETGQLVAATSYFNAGPYIWFEDFVIAPDLPLRSKHEAAECIAEQIVLICNASGKLPMCPVSSQGAVKILKRYGFDGPTVVMMTRPFAAPYDLADVELGEAPPASVKHEEDPSEEPGDEDVADDDDVEDEGEVVDDAEDDEEEEDEHDEVDPIVSGEGRPVMSQRVIGKRRPVRRA